MEIYVEKIEDEFIEQLKKLKVFQTVDVREPIVNETEITKLLAGTPFCFIHTLDMTPVPEARVQDGSATLVDLRFLMLIGSRSLRTKKEGQRGAYSLLRQVRETFEGNNFTIEGKNTGTIIWEGNQFEFVHGGLIVYSTVFGITRIN